MKKQIIAALISSALYLPTLTHADTAPENTGSVVKFTLGAGLTMGGDQVGPTIYLDYSDGSTSTDDITAGELLYIYAGITVPLDNAPIDIQTTIGYHFDSITADNGRVSFNRMPLDLLVLYRAGDSEQHRLGGGITYHMSPELDMSDVDYGKHEADNAFGFVFSYEYEITDNNYLGVRYTVIDYTFNGNGESATASGNNIGVFWTAKLF